MNNEHLVPVLVSDLIEKINNAKNMNEKMNYALRLEAIVKVCSEALEKNKQKNETKFFDLQKRR